MVRAAAPAVVFKRNVWGIENKRRILQIKLKVERKLGCWGKVCRVIDK